MSTREPRFEVVRTADGFHARFVASNGRKVWWTENYQRRGKAHAAIELLTGTPVRVRLDWAEVDVHHRVSECGLLEVRHVDERGQS